MKYFGKIPIIAETVINYDVGTSDIFLSLWHPEAFNTFLGSTYDERSQTLAQWGKQFEHRHYDNGEELFKLVLKPKDRETGGSFLHLKCVRTQMQTNADRQIYRFGYTDALLSQSTAETVYSYTHWTQNDRWQNEYLLAQMLVDSQGHDIALMIQSFADTGSAVDFNPATATYGLTINLKYIDREGYILDTYDSDPDVNENPNEPEGYGQNEDPKGTKPAHNHNSDVIGIPSMPDISTSSTGFTHMYKVSAGGLSGIGQYLFPALSNITDVESALRTIAGIFGYRDNIQYVVDLHAIPGSVPTGASQYIKIGNLETDISSPIVTSDYYDYDCGSITIPECYANYIDYLSQIKLYLPFVGMVDIDPSICVGGSLGVKYRFNAVDGSFVCYVIATSLRSKLYNTVIAQYGGSACIHLPVIANSYGALVSGLVSGAAVALTTNHPALGIASAATSVASQQAPMQCSNNYNSSTSFLGIRRPYVLLKRPWPAMAVNYQHSKGLPTNITAQLQYAKGFTIVEDIDLSGMDYTKQELDELRSLLTSGVYL